MGVRFKILIDVTFQHHEQLPQHSLALLRVARVLDAFLRMLMDDYFGEGLEGFPHGNHLGKDIRAIAVFVDHSLNRRDLTGDFAQPDLKRPLFGGWMDVRVLFHGGGSFGPARRKSQKSTSGKKGYGGILHFPPISWDATRFGRVSGDGDLLAQVNILNRVE